MANIDDAFGFIPELTDGKQARVTRYPKLAGVAIYAGDIVIVQATGDVTVGAATGQILGVAAETVAAAGTTIAVYDDPDQTFVAQISTAAAADVFLNANTVVTAGDATLGQSKQSLNGTMAVTATFQWKVLGLSAEPNNAWGAYARVKVRPNEHVFNAGTAGL
jgi:lipopolysaccharide export system protein LptA